jgi:hypothetical protein
MWYTLAPYSWISVKVGLDTSSGSAALRPLMIPLARVVFPAPRLPMRRTTARLGNSRAMRRPNSMVSSSEWVVVDSNAPLIVGVIVGRTARSAIVMVMTLRKPDEAVRRGAGAPPHEKRHTFRIPRRSPRITASVRVPARSLPKMELT